MKLVLEGEGALVDLAEHGNRAIQLVKEKRFDFILVDRQMPRRNGFEVTKDLRELGFASPILLLTASQDGIQDDDIRTAGCDGCLEKPFEMQHLKSMLEQIESAEVVS